MCVCVVDSLLDRLQLDRDRAFLNSLSIVNCSDALQAELREQRAPRAAELTARVRAAVTSAQRSGVESEGLVLSSAAERHLREFLSVQSDALTSIRDTCKRDAELLTVMQTELSKSGAR